MLSLPEQQWLWFLETLLARVTSVTGESGAQVQPDLKDRNVVVAVVLGPAGDLRPLPERLLWVADFKVSGVKLEQSEHFYLYFQGVSFKHINLWGGDERKVTGYHSQMHTFPSSGGRCSAARDMMGSWPVPCEPCVGVELGTGVENVCMVGTKEKGLRRGSQGKLFGRNIKDACK